MDWLNHPRYIPARTQVVAAFRGKKQHFSKLKHVAFLCGGHASRHRDRIAEFIRREHDDVLIFYADEAWKHVAEQAKADSALEVEGQFASLADVVIIVVESPGTFAELGAFSMSGPLREKLLAVLDNAFATDPSFINTGPVRWIDRDSRFAPSINVDFATILRCAEDLSERLSRLPKAKRDRVDDVGLSPKHLIFLLRDVVSVTGPATMTHLKWYISEILDHQVGLFHHVIGLAVALGLIRYVSIGPERFYVAATGFPSPVVRKKHLNLSTERAKIVGVMQTIPAALAALQAAAC